MQRRTATVSLAAAAATAALAFAALPIPAVGAAAAGPPLHLQDRAFLLYALELDLAQVELGELAAGKAEDEAVRQLARDVAGYHARSRDLLAGVARAHGLDSPAELSPLHQRSRALLQRLPGRAFDREYVGSQVIWDYAALYGAQRQRLHGFDAELRRLADGQARDMREQRRAAERLARRLGPAATPAGGLHLEDRSFLLYGMHVDLVQRQLGEIAAERAGDQRVRDFAHRLVDNHRRSYDRFAGLAEAAGLPPLREISSVSRRTRDGLRRMAPGPVLDWTYLNAQAFTSYGAHYRYEREAIHGRRDDLRRLGAQVAREAKEQHAEALGIMGDWNWGAS